MTSIVQTGLDLLGPIVVELNARMVDGKPLSVQLRPLSALEWAAEGRSMPASLGERSQAGRMTPVEEEEAFAFMRGIVARAITHIRGVQKNDDDTFESVWIPCRVVEEPNPAGSGMQISVQQFNRSDNFTRCWNALIKDLDTGTAELEAVAEKTFQ